MNPTRTITSLLLVAFVTASLAGCLLGAPEDEETETGTLTMYVKDNPTDHFAEIWVTIDYVEVHHVSGSGDDDGDEADNETADGNETANGNETVDGNETADTEDGRGGWIVVTNTTRSLDLMNFSKEDSKAFLGEAELDAGGYTQIRLHITDAWGIRADDGERENITVVNSPVKIVRSFEIGADTTTQVVIDIDLDRSVRSQGPPHDPHGWRMTPVIGHVIVTEGVEDDPRQDVTDDEGFEAETEDEQENGNETTQES